jgi:superfamily II DNA helicase RecQ
MASPTDDLDSLCRRLAQLSMMINGFEKVPYPWQEIVISHLNKKACHPSQGGLEPSPVFLCHPTSGGKSLVRDTFAVAQGGVMWCISPLLSLAADQETKINAGSNTTITAIHIDAYRSPATRKKLLRHRITSLSLSSPNTTIILSFLHKQLCITQFTGPCFTL